MTPEQIEETRKLFREKATPGRAATYSENGEMLDGGRLTSMTESIFIDTVSAIVEPLEEQIAEKDAEIQKLSVDKGIIAAQYVGMKNLYQSSLDMVIDAKSAVSKCAAVNNELNDEIERLKESVADEHSQADFLRALLQKCVDAGKPIEPIENHIGVVREEENAELRSGLAQSKEEIERLRKLAYGDEKDAAKCDRCGKVFMHEDDINDVVLERSVNASLLLCNDCYNAPAPQSSESEKGEGK